MSAAAAGTGTVGETDGGTGGRAEVAAQIDAVVDALRAGPPAAGPALGWQRRAVLAVVAALLAGMVGGTLVARPSEPGDLSVDAGFARDMSTHHAQAVELAMIGYRQTQDVQLRQFAYDTALTQQAQTGMMRAWLEDWGLALTGTGPRMSWMDGHAMTPTTAPDGLMPGMATPDEIGALAEAGGRDLDVLFCQLMLRHHLGGIEMATFAAANAGKAEVRRLATTMVDAQRYDTDLLRAELTALGAEPLP